jgi:hypothetical protein
MDKLNDIGPVILIIFAIAAIALVAMRARSKASQITIPVEEQERLAFEAAPKCLCGELATHPLPKLRRSRGSLLRKLFAAPPSYRREVDGMARAVLCEPHAHAADAFLDQFIFGIRQKYANLNAEIATSAAGFEQEALLNQLKGSLTDTQKRTQRVMGAPVSIRSISARNGTED